MVKQQNCCHLLLKIGHSDFMLVDMSKYFWKIESLSKVLILEARVDRVDKQLIFVVYIYYKLFFYFKVCVPLL